MSWMSTYDPNTTLYDALGDVVARYPDKEALIFGEARDTYRQLGARVDALAAGLHQLGIGKGDKVGLILPVCMENVHAFFALARIGAPWVPISPMQRAYEVRHILRDSGAAAVITVAQMMGHDFVAMIEGIRPELPDLRHVIAHGQSASEGTASLSELLSAEPGSSGEDEVGPEDLLGLFYTSGTTGFPKGAMHTHQGVLTQVATTIQMFGSDDLSAMLNHFPMFHHSGIAAPLMFLLSGGKLVLAPRFHPMEALKLIAGEHISFTVGAPITAKLLLQIAQGRDLSSLRVFGMGGSECPPELIRQLRDQLGCIVFNGLGITEAGLVATTRPDDPEEAQAHTVGRPARGVEVKIVDDDRQPVAIGQPGEIVCRGPTVMEGYYNRPGETAEVLDADGWYYTGDIGSLDEAGYLRIFDRKKDMIKRGGETIYSAEVERFLSTHPKIKMAAVIGVPSDVAGERIRAYVLPADDAELREKEVLDFCRGQLSTFKIPDEVRIVENFPLSAMWKVQKYKLREEAEKEAEA